MESTYYIKIGLARQTELETMFPTAEFENMRPGYNVTFVFPEDVDKFVAWCEENEIEAELV